MMDIVLNGQPHRLKQTCSVADLVQTLGYADRRIAVERNGEIVPRSQHVETPINEGDRLEIVVAVGGG